MRSAPEDDAVVGMQSSDISGRGPGLARVVILGAGFGGLGALTELARLKRRGAPLQITLIDKNNYHAFAPLLYQAAVGLVDSRSVAYPARAVTSPLGVEFIRAEVDTIDLSIRRVRTSAGDISYDWLIVALGSVPRYFGLKDPGRRVLPLKSIDDAARIRSEVMNAFEDAEQLPDPDARRRRLSFVIVGGGPTGLELASALRALINDVAGREYRRFTAAEASVTVLQGGHGILPGFDDNLTHRAHERLTELGVDIRLGKIVTEIDDRGAITRDGERFDASVVVWAAGVQPSPIIEAFPGERTRDGRVIARPTLQVLGDDRTFLIGDMAAYIPRGATEPLAALAPVAIQEGNVAAKNIVRAMAAKPLRVLEYQDRGNLVILGRYGAVAKVGKLTFDGLPAWLLWRGVHLAWLRGIRQKIEVLVDWSLLTMSPRQTSIIEPSDEQRRKRSSTAESSHLL